MKEICLVNTAIVHSEDLFQLNLRNVSSGDHNESNEAAGHVDFDGGALAFRRLIPRLSLLCCSGFYGRGRRETVLEGVGEDDISLRIGTFEDAHEHATVGGVYAQLATEKAIQVLNSLFSVHCLGLVIETD